MYDHFLALSYYVRLKMDGMDGNQLLLDPSVASLFATVAKLDVASLSDWDGNASFGNCGSDCLPRTHFAIAS